MYLIVHVHVHVSLIVTLPPPLQVGEELELSERPLYLRLPKMQHNIQLRSKVAMAMRETLIKHGRYIYMCTVQHTCKYRHIQEVHMTIALSLSFWSDKNLLK